MNTPLQEKRILAVDPTNRGFGFVVMEGPLQMVDWGVKEVKGSDKSSYLRKVGNLADLYRPDVLVVENTACKSSRRCARVKELIQVIAVSALNRKIKVSYVSRSMVKEVFAESGAKTKHEIAELIAEQLPELALRVPPLRKPWMSEDYRMSIFDSVAFAIAFYSAQ